MAETIEHRITDLISNGIFIMSVDGISELKSNNPLPIQSSSGDKTPSINNDELLGFFSNRGAEYVVSKCYASGKDLTRKKMTMALHNETAITSAFKYGKKLGLFDDNSESAIFEVHAITDTKYNKTHYFLMPHRSLLQKSCT